MRDQILETSLSFFEARGYAGVSLRDIADQLGLTKAALYYHFPSKQGIVEALITDAIDQRDATVGHIEADTPEALLDILRRYIRIYIDHQRVMTWLTNDMTVEIDRSRHATARRKLRDLLVRSVPGPRNRDKVFRANAAVLLLHTPVWSRYVEGDAERLLRLVCEILGLKYQRPIAANVIEQRREAAPSVSPPRRATRVKKSGT
jgi:TetR/AcrR family transcriptional regulator, regulator of cefoperazone and chloramphenicol sensitivity